MADLVKKGQPIYVSGYLKQDTWEKDGQKRVAYSMTLRDFQLCQKNGKKNSAPQNVSSDSEPASVSSAESSVDDSDIPF
jgi:single-stranded DNA-binding protein